MKNNEPACAACSAVSPALCWVPC